LSVREFLIRFRKVFAIWSVVGLVAFAALTVYFHPWTADLGVANSPQRQILSPTLQWWVWKLPFALFAASLVAARMRWLAPRGRYQEGVVYPVFSTYTYVAIALCAALFAASGVLSYEFFDLPAGPAALSVTFFNPIIGFFSLWLGGVVRSLIWGTDNPVIRATAGGLSDGSTWIYLGVFYWWFREETKWGKNPILVVIAWVVFYIVFRTIWHGAISALWVFPGTAFWGRMTWHFVQFLPSGLLGSTAGVIAAEALIRAVERGQTQALPEPEAEIKP
jgi:hypothetical protein